MFKKYRFPDPKEERRKRDEKLKEGLKKNIAIWEKEYERAKIDPEYARYRELRSKVKIQTGDPNYEPIRGIDYPNNDFLFLLREDDDL